MRIADRDAGITQQSTATGESIAMGIRAEDMAHIMGVLTDLYDNPIGAVVREYSTNAHDAHVEAGVSRPIEVTLPKAIGLDYKPFFMVRDFGSGLDRDDIAAVYSQYGRSTKRDSDDFNGALGLGCKSALTYCSMFTVESVKDAVKTIVEISRAEGGGGVMKPIAQFPTTEPNGTLVTVPIARDDIATLTEQAKEFYSYWTAGTVLLDGETPERFKGLAVSDNVYLLAKQGHQIPLSKIVMGNVAYPAPQLHNLVPQSGVLVFVPIGAVNFPPDREGLADTAKTRETVAQIKAEVPLAVIKAAQADIDAASTPFEAVSAVCRWREHLPSHNQPAYTFRGQPMPMQVSLWPKGVNPSLDTSYGRKQVPEELWNLKSDHNSYSIGKAEPIIKRALWAFPGTVWIEDFEPMKHTINHKRKAIKLLTERGYDVRNDGQGPIKSFVMLRGKVPAEARPYIDPSRIIPFADVKAVKLPSSGGSSKGSGVVSSRYPGSFDIYLDGDFKRGIPGDTFPASYPVYYRWGNEYEVKRFAKALAVLVPQHVIVCLPANRIKKFKRDAPHAVELIDGLVAEGQKWINTLTPAAIDALCLADHTNDEGQGYRSFATMDPQRLDDPALTLAAEACKLDLSALLRAKDRFKVVSSRIKELYTPQDWTSPMSRYPLFFDDLFDSHPDETYNYLNDAFKRLSA